MDALPGSPAAKSGDSPVRARPVFPVLSVVDIPDKSILDASVNALMITDALD